MKLTLLPILALLLAVSMTAIGDAQSPKKSKKGGGGPSAQGQRPINQTPSWLMSPVAGPNLHYKTFDSKAAGEKVSYLLYLPPDYETAKDRRYPVVFWLHGIGGSQTGVPLMAERLTKAISDGQAPAMIVVYVNGMIRSGWSDAQYPVETVTIQELIPHVDATYRTIATREGRMIEGFSMGGSGAGKWGFKYTDLFGSISIIDGALRAPGEAARQRPAETPANPTDAKTASDETNNVWTLAEKNAGAVKGRTPIRIVTGGTAGLSASNEKFHELLDRLGLTHEFYKIPDAPHSPNPLYEGLGDKNWPFYTLAFKDAIHSP